MSDQGIANKYHGKIKQHAFKNIYGFKTLFQGASTSTDPEFTFKNALNQRKENDVLESLEHTVFPKLLRTVKTEVLVNDDVTVSDLERDKNVSLPPCIFEFVFQQVFRH